MSKRFRRHFGSVITRPGRRGYYLRIRFRGRQRLRSSGPSKTVAYQQLAEIQIELARGRALDEVLDRVMGPAKSPVPSSPAMVSRSSSFREVAKSYLKAIAAEKRESTLEDYGTRIEVVLAAPWSRKSMDEIGSGEISLWLDDLAAKRTIAPSTLNRYRSLLSGVFGFARERDLASDNPVARVRQRDERGRQREEYLTAAELRAFIRHCPEELSVMVVVAAITGLRQGTLRSLRWGDVDLEASTLRVRASTAKGKRPQVFPLIPCVVARIRAMSELHPPAADDVLVFRTKTGRPWSRSWLCQMVRRAVDTCAAIPRTKRRAITFHTLRHSYGSLLAQDDFGMRKLQEALSHSDPRVTARYAHVRGQATREAAEKMGRILRLDEGDEVREGYHRGYQPPSAGRSA